MEKSLKQSGHNWNNLPHDCLSEQNFAQSLADPCVYMQNINEDESVFIIIWVDGIIISASNETLLKSVKDSLSGRFKMRDLYCHGS